MAGGTVMARWEAPSPGFAYCFEQQPLPGAPKQGICIQRDFPAKSIHVERGKGAPRAPARPPRLGPDPGKGLTSVPGSCRRSTGSTGVLPPRRARLGPGTGLVHLRPAAPLRQQRYVWKHGASAPGLTAKSGVPKTLPHFFCIPPHHVQPRWPCPSASMPVPGMPPSSSGGARPLVPPVPGCWPSTSSATRPRGTT